MSKTYTDLVNGVNAWLARTDLAAQVPNFVKLAEDRINRALRIRAMEKGYAEKTSGNGTVSIPVDYIEIKDFYLTATDDDFVIADDALVIPLGVGGARPIANARATRLQRISTEEMHLLNTEQTGWPQRIARSGTEFTLWPVPDQQYQVNGVYYGKFPALGTGSGQVASNWLTANAYDCIFYGCLSEAAAYIKSWDQHEFWENRFKRAMEVVQNDSDREEHSGSSLAIRAVGAKP